MPPRKKTARPPRPARPPFAAGACWYPEQWPESMWERDAARMREAGLGVVRVGEFAWSRLEPARGKFRFGWLRRALDILHDAGLRAVLGTPTACPPRWMLDEIPDLPPKDADGRVLGFGSRRHYCHAHPRYRRECARIAAALAREFGRHPAVVAWQIDNEYGCHNTALSHSDAAAAGFRRWLRRRHKTPAALNAKWGAAFWSMEYGRFAQINPPGPTPAERHPALEADFRRFTSDSIREFNRVQADAIRPHSPGRDILHNFMGFCADFDHFRLCEDLDAAAWDSYPLGFLARFGDPAERTAFARTGHPDHAAFHHDLYRGCGRGRFWVMEQQPGPVNWAPWNPDPAPGMVRLWTLEGFAHGAEVVSYFRWRQAPFAQEQMHAGLRAPDDSPAPGLGEAERAAREIRTLEPSALSASPSEVAMVFDYESAWMAAIQPHGDREFFRAVLDFYGALRRAGVNVDILPPDADFSGRKLVAVPALFAPTAAFAENIRAAGSVVLFGPRCGSKTENFAVPPNLPPGVLQDDLGLTVERVESLPPGATMEVRFRRGESANSRKSERPLAMQWREVIRPRGAQAAATFAQDGRGALLVRGNMRYLACRGNAALTDRAVRGALKAAGVRGVALPQNVRVRRRGNLLWFFNFGGRAARIRIRGDFVLGGENVPPAGACAVRVPAGAKTEKTERGRTK